MSKTFPILHADKYSMLERSIPWDVIAPHEEQARLNHGGQSLERLAERGGLCPAELFYVLNDIEWKSETEISPRLAVAFLRQLLEVHYKWPEGIKSRKIYERNEDMSPDGRLQVLIEDDGDVILSIIPSTEGNRSLPSVQFCTLAGGGRSVRTRNAVLHLAKAILDDNAENPLVTGRE